MLTPVFTMSSPSWTPWLIALALNTVLIAIATQIPKKVLTPAGLVHAWILGVLLWGCLGWAGHLLMVIYLGLGSGVTRIGQAEKEAAGIAEKRSGARGPENVWGSAFTGTLCALGVWGVSWLSTSPERSVLVSLLLLAYVASIATKLSDTCGSEIGKAYGQRTFLITTLQPVPRGTEGAVSLEGTLAGVGGSMAIALLGWAVGLITPIGGAICLIAALIATTVESLIGATLQTRWTWLTNELVNVINTLVGAAIALGLGLGWNAIS